MDSEPQSSGSAVELATRVEVVAARAAIAAADQPHFDAVLGKFAASESGAVVADSFAKAVLACQSHPLLPEIFRYADNHQVDAQLARFFDRISSEPVRAVIKGFLWNEKARKMVIREMRGECWNGSDRNLDATIRILQLPELAGLLKKAQDLPEYDKLLAILSHVGSRHEIKLVRSVCAVIEHYVGKPGDRVALELLHALDHASERYANILTELIEILQRADLRLLFVQLHQHRDRYGLFCDLIQRACLEPGRGDDPKHQVQVRAHCVVLAVHCVQAWQHSPKLDRVLSAMAGVAHSRVELRGVCTHYLKKANRLPARLARAWYQLLAHE